MKRIIFLFFYYCSGIGIIIEFFKFIYNMFFKKQNVNNSSNSTLKFTVVSWDIHIDNILRWQETNAKNQWENAIFKNKKIYKYSWMNNIPARFIAEPNNQYDNKAIMVFIDNFFVGYVPKDINEKYYNKLLISNFITADVHGGDSKYIDEYGDLIVDKNNPIIDIKVNI